MYKYNYCYFILCSFRLPQKIKPIVQSNLTPLIELRGLSPRDVNQRSVCGPKSESIRVTTHKTEFCGAYEDSSHDMASVTYSAGIDHVSGALSKPGKSGQHSCEKMLLATHRTAATTSNKCNRIYLRTPVKRTSPLTQREHQIRNRFIGVAAMIQERSHDLSKITTDQQTFIAQKNEPNGAKTMKQWYWRVCGQEWDQAHS